jgi:hypothetical protein
LNSFSCIYLCITHMKFIFELVNDPIYELPITAMHTVFAFAL